MKSVLLGAIFLALIAASVDASIIDQELVADPNFDDASSWILGVGSSSIENGHLVVINQSGFIYPEPKFATQVGERYQYSLTVDLVNNLSGGGKVTIGGQTIWEPGDDIGIFSGSIVATDAGGLVFNFLTPYLGRAEFDYVSVAVATPVPASVWLFGSGILVLIGIGRRKKAA